MNKPPIDRPLRRRAATLALTAVLALCGACTDSPGGQNDHSTQPTETALPIQAPEAASAAVVKFASTIPGQIGAAQPLSGDAPLVSPCEDPNGTAYENGPYSIQGAYAIKLPGAQQRPALQRLRDAWITAGWTDVKYREFGAENLRAEVSGVSPDEKYDVTLTSSMTPVTQLRLLIGTPCYQRPQNSTG